MESKQKEQLDLTIVTGIWNLNREHAGEGFKRPFQHYIDKFIELLKTDVPMFIFIEKEHEHIVWEHREKYNTEVRNKEVSEFKKEFPFYDKIQEIRKNEEWLNQVGWLKDSTQASLELYNPVVMSKMFMLNDAAIYNHFNTEHLLWVDGAITSTVHPGYFTHDKVFEKIHPYINKFLFLCFPYDIDSPEIHGFERSAITEFSKTDSVEYVARAGMFGGTKESIHKANGIYYDLLNQTLERGYMGTEESVFTIMSYLYPYIFDKYMIEDNGLINYFFEKLKYTNPEKKVIAVQQPVVDIISTPTIEPIKKNSTGWSPKVATYIITYNSPNQVQMLLDSFEKSEPDLLRKTDLILLNNSIDESTFDEYDKLCEKYNMAQIKKGNTGICGGRQYCAAHFAQSDNEYMTWFEDDMLLHKPEPDTCNNGFTTYIPNIFSKICSIMQKENYDFLKLSFTEFYGGNNIQWAWYNVPQDVRKKHFPDRTQLPEHGFDPNPPRTPFSNIQSIDNLSYIEGEIYYCNWPHIISKEGNKKMFLDTTWDHPFEQTWMSHFFQMAKRNELKAAVLLASPINHTRIAHYDAKERREN